MKSYNSNLAFIDLLFNLILGFVFLFIVSFILINEPTKKEGIETKAEFMVIMNWDADHNKDIDLWMEGPTGKVGFTTLERGNMFLDRDDLGHRNDSYFENNVRKVIHINREVVNIRGIVPGEYIVNAFYYQNSDDNLITHVSVEVVKLNPYVQIYQGTKRFDRKGQEETFVRFTMKSDGTVENINQLKREIVKSQRIITTENPEILGRGP